MNTKADTVIELRTGLVKQITSASDVVSQAGTS